MLYTDTMVVGVMRCKQKTRVPIQSNSETQRPFCPQRVHAHQFTWCDFHGTGAHGGVHSLCVKDNWNSLPSQRMTQMFPVVRDVSGIIWMYGDRHIAGQCLWPRRANYNAVLVEARVGKWVRARFTVFTVCHTT